MRKAEVAAQAYLQIEGARLIREEVNKLTVVNISQHSAESLKDTPKKPEDQRI